MPICKRSSHHKQKHNTAKKRNNRETDQLREVRIENLSTHATTLTTTRKNNEGRRPKKAFRMN